jgi:hypothetical protein
MSDELSLPIILPIGAVFFEILFLLIAIPLEAYILNRWLKFDKRTSIFYAIALNVFSSVIGWIVFFTVEPILSIAIKKELINYVFFNKLQDPGIGTMIVLLMKILIIFMGEGGKKTETEIISSQQRASYMNMAKLQNTNLITATLIANSLSYTAITFIILIRSLSIK